MIMRVWTGAVRNTDAAEYAAYIQATGFGAYGETPGNRGAWLLRRSADSVTEFIALSMWDSLAAVRAFAGDAPEKEILYPEDERYLIDGTSSVHHYEVHDHIPNW